VEKFVLKVSQNYFLFFKIGQSYGNALPKKEKK